MNTYVDKVKCPRGHPITVATRRVLTAGRKVSTYCPKCDQIHMIKAGPAPVDIPVFLPPRAKRDVRERDIEAYLVKRVKALGGEVRKVQWIGRSYAPDRIVMLPPTYETIQAGSTKHLIRHDRTIWVELKAPGQKPTPGQLREHERMRNMGQRVEVVGSYERVDEVLS